MDGRHVMSDTHSGQVFINQIYLQSIPLRKVNDVDQQM